MGLKVGCGRAYQEGKEPDGTGPWWATSNGVGVRLDPTWGPIKVVDWLRYHFPESLVVRVVEDDGAEFVWRQTGTGTSPEALEFMDQILKFELGRTRTDSILDGVCIQCGRDAGETFKVDSIAYMEYLKTGLCGVCHPAVFA